MSNSFVIYADISRRQLCSADGNAATLPQLTLGDTATFAVRLLDRTVDGVSQIDLKVRSLRASIGPVLACPLVGLFSLRFANGAESAMLPIGANCDAVFEAIRALEETATYPLFEVRPGTDKGVWLLRFDHAGEVPIGVATNRLFPRAFVRVRAFQINDRWWHELRLIVAPYVFVNNFYRVLSPPPSVTRIRAGDPGDDQTPAQNEVQKIHVPKTFEGTYYVTFDYRTSSLLGTTDGPVEIAAALNAMWPDGGTRFLATLPEDNEVYVEFVGPLKACGQDMISVTVNTFKAGDMTFDFNLDNADLASALRANASLQAPMEVELEVVGDDEDPDDPDVPSRTMTLFSAPATIVREQIWKELATLPPINWIRPPQPRNYIPYNSSQVITGTQFYVATIGNGTATTIVLDHNLGTDALHITLRENASGGHRIADSAYEVVFTDTNSLSIIFPSAPAANSVAVVISTAGPTSAFVSGLEVEMAQVNGLLDRLNNLGTRVGAIETLLPHVNPSATTADSGGTPFDVEIPDVSEMLPGNLASDFDPDAAAKDATKQPRAGGFLPAIHDATVDDIPVPLSAPSTQTGKVFTNNTDAPILVPGGLGRRGSHLEPGGFAGSDGRVWYRLSRTGTTNSFYPTDFERELFMLPINEQMLAAGGQFKLTFKLALQLFKATSRAQYLLVIEAGSAPAQTDPAPTGPNLQDVVWLDTPILSRRIIISNIKVTHNFGCAIRRDIDGTTMHADQMAYNKWTGGGTGSAPTDPTFVLRARLVEFDTENSVVGAKGLVYYAFTGATTDIQ